jgi:outer membrane protein assembly factor BamB
VLAAAGALAALDPASGRLLWRFEPPGAARLSAGAFGGVAVAAADTALVYGIDLAGRVVWRVRSRGAALRAPAAALGLAVVLSGAEPGTVALALDPGTGERIFEAPLDLAPAGPPLAWGSRVVVAGALAGDAAVAAVERNGALAWTVAPALSGPTSAAIAGALLVVRDAAGALAALGRDGAARWTRPAPPVPPPPGSPPPAVARGAVIAAGDGLLALDARTGELLGAVPHVAPVKLAVDADLAIAAMDGDGLVTGFRLGTHMSVV